MAEDTAEKKAGYRTLARNIQAAWIAHRMGLSIQTVLRKDRKELNDEDPHASWLEFAQMVDEGASAAFKKRYGAVRKTTIQ